MSKCKHPKCSMRGTILDNKYCSSLCYIDDLERQLAEAREEIRNLAELATNFISYSVKIKEFQMKCWDKKSFVSVEDVGFSIPIYQTLALQTRLKNLARDTDDSLTGKGLKILEQLKEQGEDD